MQKKSHTPKSVLWAQFRLFAVSWLFTRILSRGELGAAFETLAKRTWIHPTTGVEKKFGASTFERWYYASKDADDPIQALTRKVPKHTGTHPSMPDALLKALLEQYKNHSTWSYWLHFQNLEALAREKPELGKVPSYSTICRVMQTHGLVKKKKKRSKASKEFQPRERRSYECSHVMALLHSDGHECSRNVLMPDNSFQRPVAICLMDDLSRFICHLQWYEAEAAKTIVHCWQQGFMKCGLSRGILTDQGKAFHALEITEGLAKLGIEYHDTLPYSPEQNGKQETLWAQIEGRLMAMLEGEEVLTLALLNQATQAWVAYDYHRKRHQEVKNYDSPLDCFLKAPNAGRKAPDAAAVRRAFQVTQTRRQRRSDGTFTLSGVRFEVPSRYRTLNSLTVRCARWDLSSVDLVDPHTGKHWVTLHPQDKQANADGRRRVIAPVVPHEVEPPKPDGMAPLLREMMADYAATGLPPAYIPFPDSPSQGTNEDE